ncbi:MAG: outer membrane beta-barrel protein [Planctomycetota bacterium]
MNVARWTIGLAVIALGASPVLAQSAVQTAFNYKLTGCCEEPSCCCDEPSCCCDEPSCCCDEPSCCCDEPSCCCDEPSCCCDEPSCCCDDACCGDACGCGSACGLGGGGCCLLGDCNLGDPCTLVQDKLCGCNPYFNIGMWTQIGYHDSQTPLSNDFGDVLAFNDVPDQLNLHQQWLWAEKVADGSNGIGFGFRADVMYGTDAQKTQAFGNPRAGTPGAGTFDASLDHGEYGWAIPQLYGEVAFGDWSVIAGHFYTLIGYEVVTAPDNFFYSHALTMFNSEPFTHTGVLATYSGFDSVELYGGWTLGWDTGFDQEASGSSWLGGFSTSLTDDIAFTYISTAGNFGARSAGADGYSHSLVFDVALSDNLNYVFQSDLVDIDNPAIGSNDQIGINQYLFYTINDCTAVGFRGEWWKSDGQSFNEVTFGVNYRPHANVVIRPEYRYDWTPTDDGYGANLAGVTRDEESTFGIDCVITY